MQADHGLIVAGVGFIVIGAGTWGISSSRALAVKIWDIARAITPEFMQRQPDFGPSPDSPGFQRGMRMMACIQMAFGAVLALLGLIVMRYG